jgi:predicted metal-dependent hydrolase
MLEYRVRESRRAKHVRLRISIHDGLEVVVPQGFDRSEIPGLLREKERWLDRAFRRIAAERKHMANDPPGRLPKALLLRAVEEVWRVEEVPSSKSSIHLDEGDRCLVLTGETCVPDVWRPALRAWLMGKARKELPPRLFRLASHHGFEVDRVTIRCQRTRWGSCSLPRSAIHGDRASARAGSGSISLNAQLLFVPPELVEYVLIHELCHTHIPGHSPAFWRLLECHSPEGAVHRQELRSAWRFVPSWLLHG